MDVMGLVLLVPNTLISRDSVSGMKPYLKEMIVKPISRERIMNICVIGLLLG